MSYVRERHMTCMNIIFCLSIQSIYMYGYYFLFVYTINLQQQMDGVLQSLFTLLMYFFCTFTISHKSFIYDMSIV